MSFFGIKIYRDIYVKGYKRFPYQKLTGRKTLMYRGKIYCDISALPKNFDNDKDLYMDCECNFSEWKNLQRIL